MTSPQSWGITPADRDESQRDVLAVLAACLADDEEGFLAVWRHCSQITFVPAALWLLTDLLDELGIDAAWWVARKQAELAGQLAEDGG